MAKKLSEIIKPKKKATTTTTTPALEVAENQPRPGRPVGSTNGQVPVVEAPSPTLCPKCGSTKRAPYADTKRLETRGETRDGRPYSQVIWRRTWCVECHQARVDKYFE